MTRTHGRCPRGQRLRAKVPHGHWKTLIFLAALRADKIAAPCVMDGPINGRCFRRLTGRCSHRRGSQSADYRHNKSSKSDRGLGSIRVVRLVCP